MLKNVLIRAEQDQDAASIHRVVQQAFLSAPRSDFNEQFIVDELRIAGALSISLVAEMDTEIIGHVAVSPVQITDGSLYWFGLAPVSVLPAYQGQGIGSLLVRAALMRLRELPAAGCVLLGEPEYYHRFGFTPVPGLILRDVPPQYFQAVAFGPEMAQGEVTYHAAFSVPART